MPGRKSVGGLMLEELTREVRAEVEKPFQEKLEKARQLCKIWKPREGIRSAVSCSFGKDSMVVLYLVREVAPDIPVMFQNTGVEFPETIQFMKRMQKEWDLNLMIVKPLKTYWQIMDENLAQGRKIDDGSKWTNSCCYYMKEKPARDFARQNKFTHIFTGVTAMESRRRMWVACQKGMEYYAKDDRYWKVHPIMYWKLDEVWSFTRSQGIPVNPLYEKYGLDRVGCMPCTAHLGWREQMQKVNPRMYRYIQRKCFGQLLIDGFSENAGQG